MLYTDAAFESDFTWGEVLLDRVSKYRMVHLIPLQSAVGTQFFSQAELVVALLHYGDTLLSRPSL